VLRVIAVIVMLSAGAVSYAQGTSAQPAQSPAPTSTERSIEDLNLLGAATSNPPFTDTVLGADSAFRRVLYEQGVALRANVVPRFTMNLLDGPVPKADQRYIGHRPTFIWGLNPVFTADLRQLGLKHAQLNVGFAWRWVTWSPAGPNATPMSTLSLFNRWGDRRVEMKAGYNINDQAFVGLQGPGSAPATCATVRSTRTRGRGKGRAATTARTPSSTSNSARRIPPAPARDSTWAAVPWRCRRSSTPTIGTAAHDARRSPELERGLPARSGDHASGRSRGDDHRLFDPLSVGRLRVVTAREEETTRGPLAGL
jgi:hypothetical protein